MPTIKSKHSELFRDSTAKDKLTLFRSLLDAKEDMTPDVALALLKMIHEELSSDRLHDRSLYKRYAEEIEALRFHAPAALQQVINAWKPQTTADSLNGSLMTEKMPTSNELPTLTFASQSKWADWLDKQHDKAAGVWLQIAKKDSGISSVTYAEALEVALCYGWIDGQKGSFDENYFLQKFTPRRSKSIWSKVNVEKAEKLIASGQMKPAGFQAIEAAKADGRWARAYDGQKNMSIPEDFQAKLDKNKKAKAFFATLNSVNRYAFLFRIHTARKGETREKRIKQFVEMLERNEKFY